MSLWFILLTVRMLQTATASQDSNGYLIGGSVPIFLSISAHKPMWPDISRRAMPFLGGAPTRTTLERRHFSQAFRNASNNKIVAASGGNDCSLCRQNLSKLGSFWKMVANQKSSSRLHGRFETLYKRTPNPAPNKYIEKCMSWELLQRYNLVN